MQKHPFTMTTADTVSSAKPPSLLSRDLTLVCLAQAAGYASSSFLAPLLPLFLTSQGYTESFVGIVIAAFNVASFPSRPVWGVVSDRGYYRPGLTVAGVLVGAAYIAYQVPSAAFMFLVRMVHGIGWGGVNVVGSAWMALLAPANRRAEALGWYTMAQRMGTAVGPITALWALSVVGYNGSFAIGAAAASFIAVAAFFTRPTPAPERHAPAAKGPWYRGMIEPGAFLGATLVTLMSCTGPALNAYMPLYFRHLGIAHIELYYLAYGAVGIACRPVIGLFADRIGRMRAVTMGFALQVAGLAVLSASGDLAGIVAGMAVNTVGYAISEPSLYALALDTSPPARRGAAMATVTMAFQLGGGVGAAAIGAMFEFAGYRTAYASLALPATLALAISGFVWLRRERVGATVE
jgi:MFS family permease